MVHFGLQRYKNLIKYAIFLQKICFFSKKICTIQKKIVPLHSISAIAHAFTKKQQFYAISQFRRRCHRLSVRTRDFHSLKRGSIPRGTTINIKNNN